MKKVFLMIIVLILISGSVWAQCPNSRPGCKTWNGDMDIVGGDLTVGSVPTLEVDTTQEATTISGSIHIDGITGRTTEQRRPLVTIIFDDNYASLFADGTNDCPTVSKSYNTDTGAPTGGDADQCSAFAIFQDQGEVGVHASMLGKLNDGLPVYFSITQGLTMQTAGWEFACHSELDFHDSLTSYTGSALTDTILACRDGHDANGFPIKNWVYTGGYNNALVKNELRKYFRSATITEYGQTTTDPVLDQYALNRMNMQISFHTDKADAIQDGKDAIDDAVTNTEWQIFFWHELDDDEEDVLNQIIDYAQAQEVDIVTINDALDQMGNSYSAGDSRTGGISINPNGGIRAGSLVLRQRFSLGDVSFTGTTDDMSVSNYFDGTATTTYCVEMHNNDGTYDEFRWSDSCTEAQCLGGTCAVWNDDFIDNDTPTTSAKQFALDIALDSAIIFEKAPQVHGLDEAWTWTWTEIDDNAIEIQDPDGSVLVSMDKAGVWDFTGNPVTKKIWFGGETFFPHGASGCTPSRSPTNQFYACDFDYQTATDFAYRTFSLPVDYKDEGAITITLYWHSDTASTSAADDGVRWEIQYKAIEPDNNELWAGGGTRTITADHLIPTTDSATALQSTTLALNESGFESGEGFMIRLGRVESNAADDHGDDARFIGALFTYEADTL